jgi:aldose 1-epimerase
VRQSDPEQQLSIHHRGGSSSIARISRIGAALEGLTLGGVELIAPPNSDWSKMFFGSVLAPWPNRLADGGFDHNGQRYRVGTLDADNNANHGLLYNQKLQLASHSEDSLSLEAGLADAGYPWKVKLGIDYSLSEWELQVRATAFNESDETAPFAIGFHPYFLTGESFLLEGNFTHRVTTDSRMLPKGIEEVSGFNYSGGELDSCFFGSDQIRLTTPHATIEVTLQENLSHFMFYRPRSEVGNLLAIEPMSCGADAFNRELSANLLAPGEEKSYRFSVRKL